MTEQPGSKILVIEDESHIAFGIKFNLEAEGFQVLVAEDGPIGLKMIEDSKNHFQLVILDLMLPGMSGYAVCRQLREAGIVVHYSGSVKVLKGAFGRIV